MDKSLVTLYQKICTFNEKFEYFRSLNDKYNNGELESESTVKLFSSIKSVYTFYYKFVKFLLKLQGCCILYPRDIFEQAKKRNLIDDTDIWLAYIDSINTFLQEKDSQKKDGMMLEIINRFGSKLYKVQEYINNIPLYKESEEMIKSKFKEYSEAEIRLSDNKPVYNCEELHISEKSYNLILNLFKSQKYVRNVWLFGSRCREDYLPASDIDFIIDCPPENYARLCGLIEGLTIPYTPDYKNLYISEDIEHIKISQYMGTKKIYCSEDFTEK